MLCDDRDYCRRKTLLSGCCLKSGHSYDGDGKLELGLLSPFHGNSLTIWHLDDHNNYVPQWKYAAPEKETEMLHATWADTILGKPTWLVGWRQGTRLLLPWKSEAQQMVSLFP